MNKIGKHRLQMRHLKPGQKARYYAGGTAEFEIEPQMNGTLLIQSCWCFTKLVAEPGECGSLVVKIVPSKERGFQALR